MTTREEREMTEETTYLVLIEVAVTLAGAPTDHTRSAVWENVIDRLHAGDAHDLTRVRIMPRPARVPA